ncbi:MAG TPA: hypothetical protein VE442_02555 [Jatrophihabitans sp.]|nr:hypothetical protein [Jatrophihabitans sp.]
MTDSEGRRACRADDDTFIALLRNGSFSPRRLAHARRIRVAVSIGIACAVVGIVIGLRMALHTTVVDCADGTYFPEGTTDFRCYAHKQAGDGTAIVLISAMLGILIWLSGVIATSCLASHRGDEAERDRRT